MHLRHLHLPGLTPYPRSSFLQNHLVALHLNHLQNPTANTSAPPSTLLTFQTTPTYTTGRRDTSRLSPSRISHLLADGRTEHYSSLRGGQTTFHGPGQLTAYLILNLRIHNFTARSYVQFLEDSVISTCARFGVRGYRTENPGVWTKEGRKLASVGVHLRRYVSSFGVGVNVSTDLEWFDRIVICGLVGKKATSFEVEGCVGRRVEEVGGVLAEVAAGGLDGVDGVREVAEEEIVGGMDMGGADRGTA
ncbi:MAG: hypothetical protein L6R41_004037 [Letrouitia leprolyta]|nr:MAG: hypothetical protein L6R41_004037 [Letrouitia leprolyta]